MTPRRKLLLVLMTATLTSSFAVCLFPPFFPRLAEEKGATATIYGFVIGVNCLTSFLVTPMIGKNVKVLIFFDIILRESNSKKKVTSDMYCTFDFCYKFFCKWVRRASQWTQKSRCLNNNYPMNKVLFSNQTNSRILSNLSPKSAWSLSPVLLFFP